MPENKITNNKKLFGALIILSVLILSWYLSSEIKWLSPMHTYQMNVATWYLLKKSPIYPSRAGYERIELLKDPISYYLTEEITRKHKDVFKVWIAGKTFYGISNLGMVRYILENSPDLFDAGKMKRNYFSSFMKDNVGINEYDRWLVNRPFNEEVLGFRNVGASAHVLAFNKIESYIFDLSSHLVLTGDDFEALGTRAAYGIIFGERYAQSENYPYVIDMFKESQSNLLAIYDSGGITPLSTNSIRASTRKKYHDFVSRVWADPPEDSLLYIAKKVFVRSDDSGVIEGVAELRSDGNSTPNVVDQIPHWFFPIRNLITVPVPIFFMLLSAHPDVYDKLKEEVAANGSSTDYVLSQGTYLHYCVTECLRLFGIVTTLLRNVVNDITINGYKFKKGSQLLIASVLLTRSPECFPDHNIFRPERWEEISDDGPCDIIFGAGKQKCPGADLGRTLFKKIVNDLLKSTEFEVLEPVLDRNDLPHFISPWRLKMGLKRKKVKGFGYEAFKV